MFSASALQQVSSQGLRVSRNCRGSALRHQWGGSRVARSVQMHPSGTCREPHAIPVCRQHRAPSQCRSFPRSLSRLEACIRQAMVSMFVLRRRPLRTCSPERQLLPCTLPAWQRRSSRMGSMAAAASATTDIVRMEEKQTALTAGKAARTSELLAVEVSKITGNIAPGNEKLPSQMWDEEDKLHAHKPAVYPCRSEMAAWSWRTRTCASLSSSRGTPPSRSSETGPWCWAFAAQRAQSLWSTPRWARWARKS